LAAPDPAEVGVTPAVAAPAAPLPATVVAEPLGTVVELEWVAFLLPADELSGSLLAPAQPPAAMATIRTPNPQARRHH